MILNEIYEQRGDAFYMTGGIVQKWSEFEALIVCTENWRAIAIKLFVDDRITCSYITDLHIGNVSNGFLVYEHKIESIGMPIFLFQL